MEEKNYTNTVPKKEEGGNINAESTAWLNDAASARALFEIARNRLLDVNNWKNLAGESMAEFQLTDQEGTEVQGFAREGLFFRIDIPGPGTKTGEGYDWVVVEKIETYQTENIDSIGIKVRPAPSPVNNDKEVAHFYAAQSTSTFTVTRENMVVTAAVYDRNTKTNTDSGNLLDKLRNVLTGAAGIVAVSKIQWEMLTDGLISSE